MQKSQFFKSRQDVPFVELGHICLHFQPWICIIQISITASNSIPYIKLTKITPGTMWYDFNKVSWAQLIVRCMPRIALVQKTSTCAIKHEFEYSHYAWIRSNWFQWRRIFQLLVKIAANIWPNIKTDCFHCL